jgi:hypothetical protein
MNCYVKRELETLAAFLSETRYTHFISGKNVVIVGPDTTLLGSKKGNNIEKHDLIVRFNTAVDYMPFNMDIANDIGYRTDILYQCPSSIRSLIRNDRFDEVKKMKYIVYQNGNKNNKYMLDDYVYAEEERKLKKILNKINVNHHYSHESCKVLSEVLSKLAGKSIVPRTGMLAIWDMLVHGANKIDVEGMSFYVGGGHMFRTVDGSLDPLKNHKGDSSPHNSNVEVELFNILKRSYPHKF